MSDVLNLVAERRERAGKGAARAARRAGRIPGVIYGAKKDPVMINLDPKALNKELNKAGFFATLFDVEIDGKKERALPRDVQFDPVTDRAIHIDLLRVSAATAVTVNVPVNFINEDQSPGLTKGGVLNVVRYEIELNCRADAIPQELELDLSSLDLGDSAHFSMISLPDGVEPTITDRDFTVATIAAPSAVKSEAAEAAEAAEAEAEGEGEGGEAASGDEGASED
ncbi:50S ribosomal protein L25/general stress protein Ctc [Denitrobaculum tricleocarpae]|uniref:Large ribosomal subunit protein bL25 n=1 Tax=Denitrobaculum tricleocarpae TaxID=2591009 RepID=A0A545U236_9PROT|nr:50S ribosomal protein L25/general stress protein Ctc [Denitrobaculum tricleocarpae]TQV83545.1 50S ribosomal protein L25/general stress protein Ctc [Denitrobaculum tricleocarpae]